MILLLFGIVMPNICYFAFSIILKFQKNIMSMCTSCKEKEKQCKILKADLQFEIKKMTEDLAQEKVTLELQFQKESKKIMEKYNKEKCEREEENKKWIAKYDCMVEEFEEKIKQLHSIYIEKQSKVQNQIKQKYDQREQEIKTIHISNVGNLKKHHSEEIKGLVSKYQQQMTNLKKNGQEKVKQLQEEHIQHVETVAGDYDNRIKNLKKQLSQSIQNYDKLKLESHHKQTLLYEQLYMRKQQIIDLKYKTDELKQAMRNVEEELRFKKIQIDVLKQQHEEKTDILKKDFETEKDSLINEFNQQIESILRRKYDDCQKFQQVVKEIQEKRQTQIKMYENSLKEVKELVEQRPSRQEDVEQINTLKVLLNQKEKEFQMVLEEAKCYRLELNNKEETFNRIFTANSIPLNIEKINGKKKQLKISRGSSSLLKDPSRYGSVGTFQVLASTCDFRRQKANLPKSAKLF